VVTHIIPTESPVLRELNLRRAELETLDIELSQRELELATLRGKLMAFERRYLRIVGVRQAELDEIEAQVWEMLVKYGPEDSEVSDHARQARFQAQASSETVGYVREMPAICERFEPSLDLKQYYREIAKMIHPDLAADEHERAIRTALMAEVNVAYQNGNEGLLRKIFLRWKDNPQNLQRDDPNLYLAQTLWRINQVKERLLAIQGELTALAGSELYRLMHQAEETAARGIDLLEAMAKHLDQQVVKFKQRLADMVYAVSDYPL